MLTEALAQVRANGGPSVSMGLALSRRFRGHLPRLAAAADEELCRAKRAARAVPDPENRRLSPKSALALDR